MNFNVNSRRLHFPNNIQVNNQHTINKLIVVWDRVKNPDEELAIQEIQNVQYNVYRGTSISGIFYRLNTDPIEGTKFEDNNVSLNPNTQYFYKVSTVAVYDKNDSSKNVEGVLSPPAMFMIPTTNKWFKKMNERNMWILKNTGVLMDLYTRKTEGEKCTQCYDDIRGQAGDSNCLNCLGTGLDGGYEPMFQLYVRQKPAPQQLDLINMGYAPNSSPGAWTISKVLLKNRDILINPYGKMFSVTSSNVNHAAGFFFHQELTMKELDPTDIKHQIKRKNLYPDI